MVEIKFSTQIKAIQSYWGGEFKLVSSYLQTLYQISCQHTQSHNGVDERCHRTFVEILSHANLIMLILHANICKSNLILWT